MLNYIVRSFFLLVYLVSGIGLTFQNNELIAGIIILASFLITGQLMIIELLLESIKEKL